MSDSNPRVRAGSATQDSPTAPTVPHWDPVRYEPASPTMDIDPHVLGSYVDYSQALGAVRVRDARIDALEAQLATAQAALNEREGDMHARIRAGYDKTVADAWRAKLAEVARERDAARAELAALQLASAEVLNLRAEREADEQRIAWLGQDEGPVVDRDMISTLAWSLWVDAGTPDGDGGPRDCDRVKAWRQVVDEKRSTVAHGGAS